MSPEKQMVHERFRQEREPVKAGFIDWPVSSEGSKHRRVANRSASFPPTEILFLYQAAISFPLSSHLARHFAGRARLGRHLSLCRSWTIPLIGQFPEHNFRWVERGIQMRRPGSQEKLSLPSKAKADCVSSESFY